MYIYIYNIWVMGYVFSAFLNVAHVKFRFKDESQLIIFIYISDAYSWHLILLVTLLLIITVKYQLEQPGLETQMAVLNLFRNTLLCF